MVPHRELHLRGRRDRGAERRGRLVARRARSRRRCGSREPAPSQAKILVAGAGRDWPTAQEAVLKLREGAWVSAGAHHTEQLLHGHLAAIDETVRAYVLEGEGRAAERARGRRGGAPRARLRDDARPDAAPGRRHRPLPAADARPRRGAGHRPGPDPPRRPALGTRAGRAPLARARPAAHAEDVLPALEAERLVEAERVVVRVGDDHEPLGAVRLGRARDASTTSREQMPRRRWVAAVSTAWNRPRPSVTTTPQLPTTCPSRGRPRRTRRRARRGRARADRPAARG